MTRIDKPFRFWRVGIALAGTICVTITLAQESTEPSPNEFPSTVQITPVLNAHLEPGRTVIWCATFQMVWDELRNKVAKGPVHVKDGPAWVEDLNAWPISEPLVSPGSYVTMVGLGKDGIIKRINRALEDTFGEHAPPFDCMIEPNDLFAYAYLAKDLPFAVHFEELEAAIRFNDGLRNGPVKAFGYRGRSTGPETEKLVKQVQIISYVDENDFILGLKPRSDKDRMVLAKALPKDTLRETLDAVMNRAKTAKHRPTMRADDSLAVPKILFDQEHAFAELVGRSVGNPDFPARVISGARQRVRFRLDEHGAKLRSDASIRGVLGSSVNRHFVFDQPFLVYLIEKNKPFPYFVAWIGSADALTVQPAE